MRGGLKRRAKKKKRMLGAAEEKGFRFPSKGEVGQKGRALNGCVRGINKNQGLPFCVGGESPVPVRWWKGGGGRCLRELSTKAEEGRGGSFHKQKDVIAGGGGLGQREQVVEGGKGG